MTNQLAEANISVAGSAIGGDLVARDKIVNNIQHIYQRALTAAETAAQDRSLETQMLARGVSVIAAQLQAIASETSDTEARDANPYKGLLAYRLSDAEIFFGRSQAIAGVLGRLQRGRLTVLHSESGSGKSSLLQAGISPRLIGAGHLPLYLRPYNNYPGFVVKRAFISDLGQAPLLASAPLREFLRQVNQVLGAQTMLYIFLDQFEEFFTQLNAPAREDFANELAECLDDESLNVRWMFSLRTEYFGNLATLRPQIRNPFENDFRLNRLTHAEAHEVILAPVQRRGITFEPGLVDTILDDLGKDQVPPPEIQLVCLALYEDLSPGQTTLTRERYNALGGAPGILSDHLDRVLSRDLPPAHRPIAQRILESLITSDGRRLIRTRAALATEVEAAFPGRVSPEALDSVLNQLADSRLLRPQEQTEETPEYELAPGLAPTLTQALAYELAHDYLLDKIKLDPAAQARKAAEELLEQEMRAHERYGSVISPEKLAIIEARRNEIAINSAAQKLIELSERRLKRRQRLLIGGAGVVILLLVVGVVAIGAALSASVELQRVELGRATAEVQQATANAGAVQAATREAEARFAVEAAKTEQAEREAEGQRAATAIAASNDIITSLFRKTSLVTVADGPEAILFDGEQVWVACAQAGLVQAVDPPKGIAGPPIPVDGRPTALAYDGQRVWVGSADGSEAGKLQAVDPGKREPLGEPIQIDGAVTSLIFDGQRLWVGTDSGQVGAIDPESRQAVGEPVAFSHSVSALAFGWGRLWVATADSTLRALDPDTGREVTAIATGAGTSDMVFDGSYLWIVNAFDNTVQAIDPTRNQVAATLTVGVSPQRLVFDGTRLWVSTAGDDTVQAIDPTTFELDVRVRVGRGPIGLAFDGRQVWASISGDNTVQAFSSAVRDLSDPIQIAGGPGPLVFDGQRVWAASYLKGMVQAIDPDTNQLVAQPIAVGSQPSFLAFDGTKVWVVNRGSNSIQSIVPETGEAGEPIPVGQGPFGLLFDGQHLWVSHEGDGTLLAIDPATGQTAQSVQLEASPGFMTFDGVRLWVASSSGLVSVDPTSGAIGQAISDEPDLQGLAFDGSRLWAVEPNRGLVLAFDPLTGRALNEVKVGNVPNDLRFDGSRLWVTNTGDNTLQAINPETGETEPPIRVGDGPLRLTFDGQRIWVSNYRGDTVQAMLVKK